MRVVSADLWEPAPGQVFTWDVTPGTGPVPEPAPITFNQLNHLLGADRGEPSVWITAAFDVEGSIDVAALEEAFRDLVARHPGLQVEAVRRPLGQAGGVGLVRHDPGTLVWQRADGPVTRTVAATREHLVAELARRCAPFGYPAFLPAVISRPDRSTIVLGMDHLHTDAWSTTVVIDELAAAYAEHARHAATPVLALAGAVAAGGVGTVAAARPMVVVRPTAAAASALPVVGPAYVGVDDPRLATWHGFLRERGWALPTFPLPLGLPDGERAPQRTVVCSLADSATADAVARRAAGAGASTSAAVLATFARAVQDLGGPTVLDTLLPVHTRADESAHRAVGWHTTTVPLRIEVDAPVLAGTGAPSEAGADIVTDTAIAATGKALRAARELSAVPLEQLVDTLPHPLRFPRRDIFQVSYLDYRRLPGHAAAAARRAHHVSAATRADDLQVWVSRTADGIAVRARMPRTDVAVETIDALLDRWAQRLTELTRG